MISFSSSPSFINRGAAHALVGVLLCVTTMVLSDTEMEMVITPFGPWPVDCVAEHESGSIIDELPDGSKEVTSPTGVVRVYAPKPHCVSHARDYLQRRASQRLQARNRKMNSTSSTRESLTGAGTGVGEEGTAVKDGWNTYVSHTIEGSVAHFSGSYNIPKKPSVGFKGQTLFYFLGTQDNNDPAAKTTILQPVLTFGVNCQPQAADWCMSSWNCCPGGETTHAPYIENMAVGGTAKGFFNFDKEKGTGLVSSTYNGKSSVLKVKTKKRTFNWPDISLEVYDVKDCNQFAGSPQTISKLNATDATGKKVKFNWQPTIRDKSCNARQSYDQNHWTVQHN